MFGLTLAISIATSALLVFQAGYFIAGLGHSMANNDDEASAVLGIGTLISGMVVFACVVMAWIAFFNTL